MLKVVSSSEALLALADMDPSFVSQNEVDAQRECDVIFPLGFTSMSEEEAEAEMMLAGTLEPENEGEEHDGSAEQNEVQEENAAQNNESEPTDENGYIQRKIEEPAIIETEQFQAETLEEVNNAEIKSAEENNTKQNNSE